VQDYFRSQTVPRDGACGRRGRAWLRFGAVSRAHALALADTSRSTPVLAHAYHVLSGRHLSGKSTLMHIGQAELKDTMGERSKASNFKIVLLGEGRVGKTSMVGPLS